MTAAVGTINTSSTMPAPSKGAHGMSFGEVISCLNPLQYVPVVGMIYRAVTGDTIPDAVRDVGSLVFSGLTSGPVGVGISLGVDAVERAVGFDEEKFGQSVLASLGIGHAATAAGSGTAVAGAAVAGAAFGAGGAAPQAFTAADLARFGLSESGDGTVNGRGLSGADALNAMELSRIASTAYARTSSETRAS